MGQSDLAGNHGIIIANVGRRITKTVFQLHIHAYPKLINVEFVPSDTQSIADLFCLGRCKIFFEHHISLSFRLFHGLAATDKFTAAHLSHSDLVLTNIASVFFSDIFDCHLYILLFTIKTGPQGKATAYARNAFFYPIAQVPPPDFTL
jgi:hypothetical protein